MRMPRPDEDVPLEFMGVETSGLEQLKDAISQNRWQLFCGPCR